MGDKKLTKWLETTIGQLPTDKAQIVLNIDASTVDWEVRTVQRQTVGDERETVETKRTGRLQIARN